MLRGLSIDVRADNVALFLESLTVIKLQLSFIERVSDFHHNGMERPTFSCLRLHKHNICVMNITL